MIASRPRRRVRETLAVLVVVAATVTAGVAQEPPESAAGRLLDDARLEAESALGALEAHRILVERRIAAERAAAETANANIVEITAALRSDAERPAVADALYDRIVSELSAARPSLAAALASLSDPSEVPESPSGPGLVGLDTPPYRDRVAQVARLREQADDLRRRLASIERDARWETVELRHGRVAALQALRLEALGRLSPGRRASLLGVSRDGVAQLSREADHFALETRYWLARRSRDVRQLPGRLTDVFLVGAIGWAVAKALVLVVLVVWLRRRVAPWALALRAASRRAGSRTARGRRLSRGAVLLEVFAPWGSFLVALAGLRWAIGAWATMPEIDLPLRIAFLYGGYRLAIAVLAAASIGIAGRYRLRLDDERRAKIQRSVVVFLRLAVGVLVATALSEVLVGRGYVFHLVTRFGWLIVLATVVQVLVSWRGVIADAYLRTGPPGRLANTVRATRERSYGVFVAAAAFAWLAGRALVILARDFALGFDQTRRALAFLFRRQVERRAERHGYAEVAIEALPAKVVEAFDERETPTGGLALDHFPGLDRLHAAIAGWSEGDGRGSFLLTGERGMGKSSWLARVDPGELPCRATALARRVTTAKDAIRLVWEGLEPEDPSPPASPAEARDRLLAGPRRVAIVDVGQNLFLATVGGFAALEAFTTLVDETSRAVFWLFAINEFSWSHATAVRPDLNVFRDHQRLEPWSEETIRDLIATRMEASGVGSTFEDLLDEDDRVARAGDRAERLEQTRIAFLRLLWDYSDGNPRSALHFWLRSLVPDRDGRVRVRPFRAPDPEKLAVGGDAGLFVLSAIVLHENLTSAEVARTTRYPEPTCRSHLDRFVDLGALSANARRYRVTAHWHRAVVRRLRRANLLPL